MKLITAIAAMILVVCLWNSAIAAPQAPTCPNPHAHVQPQPYVYPPIVVPPTYYYRMPYGMPYDYRYQYWYNPYYGRYNWYFQYRGPRGFNFQFGL